MLRWGLERAWSQLRKHGGPSGSSGIVDVISSRMGHADSYTGTVALELEICKGLAFLKRQDLAGAYIVLQQLEKREEGLSHDSVTNL